MSVHIKIDNREHDLIPLMKGLLETIPLFQDIKVTVDNLPLGDIVLLLNDSQKVIIERKSINDLAASIKDGRYEEQSYRLNGLDHHNHNIIYLIEGDMNKINRFKERMDKLTIYSAIFSLNYYKGFSVMRTFSLEETALFICNSANKMRKSVGSKTEFYTFAPLPLANDLAVNVELEEKDYVSVIKKIKKDNITPNNIGEIMLCQIPGISSVTACAIMQHFKTLPQLIETIKEKGESCLKDITYTTEKGQVRKISKTCNANIVKFLLNVE